MNKSSDRELERRLRALTETVISKQTTIEALSVDKSSLTLELERFTRNQVKIINIWFFADLHVLFSVSLNKYRTSVTKSPERRF